MAYIFGGEKSTKRNKCDTRNYFVPVESAYIHKASPQLHLTTCASNSELEPSLKHSYNHAMP